MTTEESIVRIREIARDLEDAHVYRADKELPNVVGKAWLDLVAVAQDMDEERERRAASDVEADRSYIYEWWSHVKRYVAWRD